MRGALLLALFLTPPAAAADDMGPVYFTVTPPPARVPLAETFSFRVEASLPESFSLRPDTTSASNSEFELVSFVKAGEEKSDGRRRETFDVKSKPFTLGVSTYPAIAWELRGAGVPEGTVVRASTFTIEVLPLFKDTEGKDIRDIYQPYGYFPWHWLLALLALAAAGLALYRRFRRPAAAAAAAAWKDGRSAYRLARDRLGKLEGTPLAAAGKLKEYYTGLTAILRLYLYDEFAIDAAQMTTADLTRVLKNTGAGIKTSLKARELLEKADLVKFARLRPEDAAADSAALGGLLDEFNQAAETARAEAARRAAEAAAAARRGGKPA